MAQADMLPVIFFSVLFGLGVAAIGEKGKPILAVAQGVADAMFWVTNLGYEICANWGIRFNWCDCF